jgi:hypothetical protein
MSRAILNRIALVIAKTRLPAKLNLRFRDYPATGHVADIMEWTTLTLAVL